MCYLEAVVPIQIYFSNIISVVKVRKVPLFTLALKGLFLPRYGAKLVNVAFTPMKMPEEISKNSLIITIPTSPYSLLHLSKISFT